MLLSQYYFYEECILHFGKLVSEIFELRHLSVKISRWLICQTKERWRKMWELVNKPSPSEEALSMMARAQDKALGTTPPKTFFLNLDTPINTISTNKDFTQIVVAGRSIFKILDINETSFCEKLNLRVGRINLNYSIIDVLWHHFDDNTIATAAGNGAVALWDLNKSSRTKQDFVFYDHKRTVNKICFHPNDASILLSGSQDGTINHFDLRKKLVATKFFARSDSIRDVQFNPFDRNTFAAACESGGVQLWDLRKPDHAFFQFTGHYGPVFSLDWHPEDRSWLGTGGRDKKIKVWNIHSKGEAIHCVSSIAEVACVRWRPKGKFHIASCALVVDHHVSVWDIRRPYIPFAAFTRHQDVATGMIWHKEADALLSCSKDSTLYQHAFQDATRPADHAPPVGLSISCWGDICNACSNSTTEQVAEQKRHPPIKQMIQAGNAMPTFFKRAVSIEDDFKAVISTLKLFSCREILDESPFHVLAKSLVFSGRPFPDICMHNAKVCHVLQLHQKAQTWLILKFLFADVNAECDKFLETSLRTSGSENLKRHSMIESNNGAFDESATDRDGGEDIYTDVNKDDEIDLGVGADFDAIFQDDQFDGQFFATENINEDGQDWMLPNEAFQPRHSIGEKSLTVDHGLIQESSSNQSDPTPPAEKQKSRSIDEDFRVLGLSKFLGLPDWDFKPLVVDMLHHFAENGDVQMAVTVLIVLQNRLEDAIDSRKKEEWFLAYLELLNRLRLWTIATKIINLSNIPSITVLNQDSTTINTTCGGCNKAVTSLRGWFCERCKTNTSLCSICHLPVKGMYAWCQGCGHGGHLVHMQDWVRRNQQCPAGCGHRCEYS